VANAPTSARNAFSIDLVAAQAQARAGVVPDTQRRADGAWAMWTSYCATLAIDPLLDDIDDPVALLQVYALRIRDGRYSRSGGAVRASTVDTELRHVGQTLALLGTRDPRLTANGKRDIRLSRQSAYWRRHEDPPTRVKPIPVPILIDAVDQALTLTGPAAQAIRACADMVCLAYYFILRPGEYVVASGELSSPFRLADVELFVGQRRLDTRLCTDADVEAATFLMLTFTNQKNSVRGEKIGHGRSGHARFCPVLAATRRVLHLRQHQAPDITPLYAFYIRGRLQHVYSRAVTPFLRRSVAATGNAFGIRPEDIEARSLRASGAMALLCARVDTDLIRLIGRWRSDAMLRYLHVQAVPIMTPMAGHMLAGGAYTLQPALPTAP
jgi:hypothetical protein